jgi:hypothetical protein
MGAVTSTPFQQALELIERLPVSDQEALLEVVRHRLLEQRRGEIAANAQATLQAFREGRARYGTLDDLRRDLVEEE